MVGTGHIHPIDLNNLISRTESTILSDQSFREDFLYHYASLKKKNECQQYDVIKIRDMKIS